MLRNLFFGKILCSTHQKKFSTLLGKKWFYKLLGSFWKIEFLTENRQPQKWWKFWPYKNGENFVKSQNVLRIDIFRHPAKWWKFCSTKNFFFGKILSSKKKCFYKLLGSFWKIEFLTENRQPRTLQNWWKFCTISNVLRKYFLAKFFAPLIKRSVSTNF